MRVANEEELRKAAEHLAKHDKILGPVVTRAGLANIKQHTNYYGALVDSIISQQLSVKAAATIEKRFRALFNSADFPPPDQILTKSIEELRSAGLSGQKANYIRDLAQHVLDGKLRFDSFNTLSNEQITAELVDVKGIGEWTAHMFLIFCMGRLDVLPVGDLGIRSGIRTLYGFDELPTPQQIIDLAENNHWHPYESIASWYIWHSLDNKPSV